METALKKDVYEHLAPVWTGSCSRDFTAESIVPDAMPDVAGVVDAEGVITLRSKEAEAGAVALAASLSVSVMYMPDGGDALQSLSVTVPVELRMDAPGADLDCQTVARMRVRAIDARMVNSRKLSVRADVDCEATVYQKRSLTLASGLESGGETAHILTRTAAASLVTDVREKTFVVTDEYPLPAGLSGVERLLSQRVDALVEDVKYVTGKVVFRGRLRAALVLGGPDGQIAAGRYETEFSQIMEVGAQSEDALGTVTAMFTGVYFDLPERDGDGHVKAELHLVAQTVCREAREIVYIADLYSNRTQLTGQTEPFTFTAGAQPISMRQTVTGSTDLMGAAGEVLTASAVVGNVTAEGDTVKTTVNVRAILRQEGGGCTTARCRLTAEFTADLPAGTVLQSVTVTASDVYCAAAGGSLDVRIVLQMDATAASVRCVDTVAGVDEDAAAFAAAPPAPSVTLVRLEQGADMWAVAKKYRSTVEAIAAANGDRQGGLVLIPKAR